MKFNGVLCGRATWKEGIPIYAKQGAAAFRKWLETEGVKNIQQRQRQIEGRNQLALDLWRRASARIIIGGNVWERATRPLPFYFYCVAAGIRPPRQAMRGTRTNASGAT